jgi:tRNA (guanine-N7-)-methyltransferase
MSTLTSKPFRLRSFVRRDSRRTASQKRAYAGLWPQFGLPMQAGLLDYQQVFHRDAKRFLEIGFGKGESLLALAKTEPNQDFIGVETHKPGIGAICLGIESHQLTNLRIYDGDVIDVLQQCIPPASLHGVQIFFPDPWPKRRHHARRLIQQEVVSLIVEKLKIGGTLHLSTDWEDYARHMMRILSQEKRLVNLAGDDQFAARSIYRPILTKFERRALREGRQVWELQFAVASG